MGFVPDLEVFETVRLGPQIGDHAADERLPLRDIFGGERDARVADRFVDRIARFVGPGNPAAVLFLFEFPQPVFVAAELVVNLAAVAAGEYVLAVPRRPAGSIAEHRQHFDAPVEIFPYAGINLFEIGFIVLAFNGFGGVPRDVDAVPAGKGVPVRQLQAAVSSLADAGEVAEGHGRGEQRAAE